MNPEPANRTPEPEHPMNLPHPSRRDDRRKIAFFILRTEHEAAQLTGGTLSNLALITSLTRHEVLVIVNARDIFTDELERRGVPYVVLEDDELSWFGARKDLRTLALRLLRAARYNYRIGALCRREGVGVLQGDEMAALFIALGARLSGTKLVIAYRNHPGVVPKMRVIYKLPTLLADTMVATSELLREAVVTQGFLRPAARTHRIYNGVDVARVDEALARSDRAKERAALGIGEAEVAIGVIGSIVAFKRQAEMLERVIAPNAGRFRAAKVRFHFVGGVKIEEYAERCRALVKEHHLEDVTAWPGYAADMTPWLVALDLVAFPAPEGTARTLLEAAAYGIPAVARETSREAVLHGENGLLCREIEDLTGPLLRLAADRDLRERMSARGRALARERFDVRKNREEYAKIYDALLSLQRGAPGRARGGQSGPP